MYNIKESNLGNIKSVFNDSAKNAHYYRIIHNTFHENIQNIEFAKPIIQENRGVILWQTKFDGPYSVYSNLSSEQKYHIDNLIKKFLHEMSQKLGDSIEDVFLEKMIEIPGEDSIFYVLDEVNNVKVIITEWGFVKDDFEKKDGVLKKIFSQTKKSILLRFESNKGEAVEGVQAIISTRSNKEKFTSDSNGLVRLNNLDLDDTVYVNNVDNNFQNTQFEVHTRDEEIIKVNRTFNLSFNIINASGLPIENKLFKFNSDDYGNSDFYTNSNGQFNLAHREVDQEFRVFSEEGELLLSDVIPSVDKQFTITYNPPKPEVNIVEDEYVEPVVINEPVQLEFLTRNKKPIAHQKIDLYGDFGKLNFETNVNGIHTIDNLSEKQEYTIFMNYKGTDWKQEFNHVGDSKYTFIVKKRRFLWWWIPFILFFLLLLLIPTTVEHNYTVLDRITNEPIKGASISSSQSNIYQTSNLLGETDSLGKLKIDYGKSPIYKQMFYKPSSQLNVMKSGYERLDTIVKLGYFNTRKSYVYLDKPMEPRVNCNSGGDADDAGGNSIREFDLQQTSGNFMFSYNTGDIHPDLINIYDGPRDVMRNSSPIWTANEATQGVKSVSIPFTNRIVTIEVIGGGNTLSIWEYYVDCP